MGGRRPKQTAASPSERGVAGRAGRGAGIELFIDMGNSPVADGGLRGIAEVMTFSWK